MAASKKVRVIKRKKSNSSHYFHQGTQEAIEKYQLIEEDSVKEKIYKEEIFPAFDKLVENLIFMHGFHKLFDFESLKNDCTIFLYETLHKWKPDRGTKAFSYFNVVARNWLIIQSKKRTKREKRHVSIDDHDALDAIQLSIIENHKIVPSQDEIMIEREKSAEILTLLHEIKKRSSIEHEILCIDAIIQIFNHVDTLELLNKRAIFVYIRDLSGLNAKQLSIAMSQIRKQYKELSQHDQYGIF